jgi:hypothetical protein
MKIIINLTPPPPSKKKMLITRNYTTFNHLKFYSRFNLFNKYLNSDSIFSLVKQKGKNEIWPREHIYFKKN